MSQASPPWGELCLWRRMSHAEPLLTASSAGDLPLELLARILAKAAFPRPLFPFKDSSWQLLIRCSAASRTFKAAADLAASRGASVFLDTGTSPEMLDAACVVTWAQHVRRLETCAGSALCRAPGLRSFLSHCVNLSEARIALRDEQDPADGVRWDTALSACDSLTAYTCQGWWPAQFPQRLQSLTITPEQGQQGCPLELLIVRLQECPELRRLKVDLWRIRPPGLAATNASLCAPQLAGVQLPSLQKLTLLLSLAATELLDLSWLAEPGDFEVSISLHGTDHDPEHKQAALVTLCDVMSPIDELSVRLEGSSLSFDEQHVLGQMQLASFHLEVPPQTIEILPQAAALTVGFSCLPGTPARLEWSAVSKSPGKVVVFASPSHLEMLGCPSGAAPDFPQPWQLTVRAGSSVRGLPSDMKSRGDGDSTVWCMQNSAADAAGW